MAEQQILAPDTPIPGNPLARTAVPAQNLGFDGLRGIGRQPAVRKALPFIALTGAVGFAALTYFALSTPAQAPLFQGLAEADKAAVADALQASGISYSLDPGTGALSVDAGKLHEARMLLAGQGLPKAQPSGDAVMASLPMGSSRAVEGETLRGAREADLARTIEAIDSVKTARVHLATPEASVFVRESREPAASVMLTLQQGRSLSAAQVRAVRHLVASSVPNLSADAVSVIDQSGALLSSDQASADDRMFQLQLQMEERYRQSVIALLTPIAGAGNFSVEVHADIDASESQSTRETYPENDRALRTEEGNKSVSGAAQEAGGIPGAVSNQPPPASQIANAPPATPGAAGTSGGGTTQSAETFTRSFDVGREIAVTHQPQGSLRRLSVAVAMKDGKGATKRSAAEIAALENLVKGAVGFKADRGDVVAISARPFIEEAKATVNFWDEPWFFPLVQQVGAVLGAIVAFFMIGRPLVKAVKARMAAAKERSETEQQLLTATQNRPQSPNGTVTIDMIEAAPSYEARANLVRTFVKQDPQRAALVVRQMLGQRANG